MVEVERKGDRSVLRNIFRTMAYNEDQLENFSTILKWVSGKENQITSVASGQSVQSDMDTVYDHFRIGKKEISLRYLDSSMVELIVKKAAECPSVAAPQPDIWDRSKRLRSLVEEHENDLCSVEAFSTRIPLWQVKEFDSKGWKGLITPTNQTLQGSGKRVVVFLCELESQTACLSRFLPLLSRAMGFDGRVIFGLSVKSGEDATCVLPPAFLIDLLNKSKLRRTPIDLLLLDRKSGEKWKEGLRRQTSCEILICGESPSLRGLPPQRLLSGVIRGPTLGGNSAHFILHSSADLQTSIENIVVESTTSGFRTKERGRSLVFVHQPIYEETIEKLGEKLLNLKISEDPEIKLVDFIRRNKGESIAEIEEALDLGAKIFPKRVEKDFSAPTLFYEIGTASRLVGTTTPGLGHLLVLIPFRSPAEVLSMANAYGDDNSVFLFASNFDFIKEITWAIKGSDVWINQIGKPGIPKPSLMLGQLQNKEPMNRDNSDTTEDEVKLERLFGITSGSKWGTLGRKGRFSTLVMLLRDLESDTNNSLTNISTFESELMTAALDNGPDDEEESPWNINSLARPIALTAILYISSSQMTPIEILTPLFLALLKGSPVVVLFDSSDPSGERLIGNCISLLPYAINFAVISYVKGLKIIGGLRSSPPFTWVVYPDALDGVDFEGIPIGKNTVRVDSVEGLKKNFQIRAKDFEIQKIVHL